MELFVILTMQTMTSRGVAVKTDRATMTVPPDATREQAFNYMVSQMPEEFHHGSVLFFSVEPAAFGEDA